jgi:TAP-like protein
VGDYYDPATNYDEAVSTAALLPNSRLLSSDSFGHTAYGTSACVTTAVDTYLLTGALPPAGTVCKGDIQPFAPAAPGTEARTGKPAVAGDAARVGASTPPGRKQLPPVVPTGPRPVFAER